jgi:hypothetical protein
MSDLVKRLRDGARYDYSTGEMLSPDSIMDEAADRIEALEAVLRQARDELQGSVVLFGHKCHADCTTKNWLDRAEADIVAINDLLKD